MVWGSAGFVVFNWRLVVEKVVEGDASVGEGLRETSMGEEVKGIQSDDFELKFLFVCGEKKAENLDSEVI